MSDTGYSIEEIRAERERRARSRRLQAAAGGGAVTLEVIQAERARRAGPTQQQTRQAAGRAAERHLRRSMSPGGMGGLVQPFVEAITDPEARRVIGDNVQGAWRQAQQIPNLDFGRLAQDTGRAVSQGVQDLPRLARQIAGNLPQIAHEATIAPFQRNEENLRRRDLARVMGDAEGSRAATQAALGDTAQAGVNLFTPLLAGGGSALRAGATAAAIDAPFALSRGEGSLQERLPGALAEIGGVGAFGTALQGTANAIPRALARPSPVNERAAMFERAGVRPMLAASRDSAKAPMTMAIAENPFGGNVRTNLRNSYDDVAARARELSARIGQHGSPEIVGEHTQAAARRFSRQRLPEAGARGDARYRLPTEAEIKNLHLEGPGHVIDSRTGRPVRPEAIQSRDWSWKSKASAIESRAIHDIVREEQAHIAGQTGATISTNATRAALASIRSRFSGPASQEATRVPFIERIANAIESDVGANALRFNDLRQWRTDVRMARANPDLVVSVGEGNLTRLYQALTDDIYSSARELGGAAAEANLRRADAFYRAGMNRIENVLRPLDPERRGALGGRQAFDRIYNLAREGGRQNTRDLRSIRQSLRPDEWRTYVATVIDDWGRPNAGNPQALEPGAFSLENFHHRYAALSREGREALFSGIGGSDDLMAALDDLMGAAGALKGVRGFTNYSRSASSAQNIGTLTTTMGAVGTSVMTGNPLPVAGLIGLTLGMRGLGEALTNPHFVRLLTSASKSPGAGGLRALAKGVSRLAASDPALVPLAVELSQRAPAANDNPAGRQPQRARALPR